MPTSTITQSTVCQNSCKHGVKQHIPTDAELTKVKFWHQNCDVKEVACLENCDRPSVYFLFICLFVYFLFYFIYYLFFCSPIIIVLAINKCTGIERENYWKNTQNSRNCSDPILIPFIGPYFLSLRKLSWPISLDQFFN